MSENKKYRLLKDLPKCPAGTILELRHDAIYEVRMGDESDIHFDETSILSSPEFFEQVLNSDAGEQFCWDEKSAIELVEWVKKNSWMERSAESQVANFKKSKSFNVSQNSCRGFDVSRPLTDFKRPSQKDGEGLDYPVQPYEDEITFDKLDANGFTKWNDHFTYRCFPHPLYGTVRIDKLGNGEWVIFTTNYTEDITLSKPKTMTEVLNFNKSKSATPVPSSAALGKDWEGENWEIISIEEHGELYNKESMIFRTAFKTNLPIKIVSVKRKSDGEIFVVGQTVKVVDKDEPKDWWGQITGFWLTDALPSMNIPRKMHIIYNGHHYNIKKFVKKTASTEEKDRAYPPEFKIYEIINRIEEVFKENDRPTARENRLSDIMRQIVFDVRAFEEKKYKKEIEQTWKAARETVDGFAWDQFRPLKFKTLEDYLNDKK